MSFQDIPKVETADTYLDIAFRRGRERLGELKQKKPKKRPTPGEERSFELEAFRAMNKNLTKSLQLVLDAFPQYDQLSPFYKELLECSVDLARFRKSLGAVNWAKQKIESLYTGSSKHLVRSRNLNLIAPEKKILYGRVASVVKQIKKELDYLGQIRQTIRKFPVIKEGVRTVAIFGFPNVGKTTLLSKLTASRPEIAAYPFTTKTINLGYIQIGAKKVQLLDTPGTLNRFERMNDIEKQAHLALKHVADVVVFVFDLSEPYPIGMQIELYESLRDFKKPILIYFSKSDILEKDIIGDFSKKYEGFTDVEKLKEAVIRA
jgi:nucleolar GTP-binding protein